MILDTYNQATPAEVEEGMRWYEDANAWATGLAEQHAVPVESVIAITAALSPANKWPRNKVDAEHMVLAFAGGRPMEEVRVCTYNRNKACAIVAAQEGIKALTGLKVKAFAQNILEPDGNHTVTIDRHAWNLSQGKRLIKTNSGPQVTPARYRIAAEAYRATAEELGIRANQLQAITWLVWRRLIGVK